MNGRRGRYSKVFHELWRDPWFAELERDEKLTWFLLLTTRFQLTAPGVIPAGVAALAEEGTLPLETVQAAIKRFEAEGQALFDRRRQLLWLPSGMKDDPPDNPSHAKGWAKQVANLPGDSEISARIRDALAPHLDEETRSSLLGIHTVSDTVSDTVSGGCSRPPDTRHQTPSTKHQSEGHLEPELDLGELKPASRDARAGSPLDSRIFQAKGSKPLQLTEDQVKALRDEFGDRLNVDDKLTRLAAWTEANVSNRKLWKRGRADLFAWVRKLIAADYEKEPAPPADLPELDLRTHYPWGEPREGDAA